MITDAIAAAESGPTHNRLDMSCPTKKMTGSMSDSEDDRQQQGSNEQRQRQQQREESEMRGGEAESGPTHNDNRPSRSGKMCLSLLICLGRG